MFKPQDRVVAKNPDLPFWMTVDSVNVSLEIAYCSFGYSGRFAGAFPFSSIKKYKAPKD